MQADLTSARIGVTSDICPQWLKVQIGLHIANPNDRASSKVDDINWFVR